MNRTILMSHIRVVTGIAVLTVGVAVTAAAQGAASASTVDLDSPGAKVFTAQKCGLCHAIAGKGNVKGPLDEVGSQLKADEIRAWITDAPAMAAKAKATRKPPMKAFTLPKNDVDALVAYLSTLKKN